MAIFISIISLSSPLVYPMNIIVPNLVEMGDFEKLKIQNVYGQADGQKTEKR